MMRNTILSAVIFWSICACAAPPNPSPATQPAGPKFIIGVWYQPMSSFATWKARGINTMVGYEGQSGAVSRADYQKAARDVGLYYILKPTEDPAEMKADAADPNLLAWEQPDEPDNNPNLPPATIIANYKRWKAISDKPVMLNFDGWQTQWVAAATYQQFVQGADWIGFDYYIINRGEGPEHIDKIGERLDKLKEWGGGKKKLFVFIECADMNSKVQDWANNPDQSGTPPGPRMRAPTADEMKKEVDVAVKHGASAIIYFPDRIGKSWEAFDATPPDLEAAMKEINRQLVSGDTPAGNKPATAPREVIIDGVRYVPAK